MMNHPAGKKTLLQWAEDREAILRNWRLKKQPAISVEARPYVWRAEAGGRSGGSTASRPQPAQRKRLLPIASAASRFQLWRPVALSEHRPTSRRELGITRLCKA